MTDRFYLGLRRLAQISGFGPYKNFRLLLPTYFPIMRFHNNHAICHTVSEFIHLPFIFNNYLWQSTVFKNFFEDDDTEIVFERVVNNSLQQIPHGSVYTFYYTCIRDWIFERNLVDKFDTFKLLYRRITRNISKRRIYILTSGSTQTLMWILIKI